MPPAPAPVVVPAATVYDKVTATPRRDVAKHGHCCGVAGEILAIDNWLDSMTRREFLEAISDAIEERIQSA